MKKLLLAITLLVSLFSSAQAQGMSTGIPDSVMNLPRPGSNGAYTVQNPLNHNGVSFTNPPVTASCFQNCSSDYLYFHDLDLQMPVNNVLINGVEVIHTRGGCNQGSYAIDSVQLAYQGAAYGATVYRDSTSTTATDTLGSPSDLWNTPTLNPNMVSDPSFGVLVFTNSTGICTFGQFDLRVRVYYCEPNVPGVGIPDSVENVAYPGSNGAYSINGPLNHNGTAFQSPPITANCAVNCKSDYLYFHHLGLNLPPAASIAGVEVIHTRGGCNQGSYGIDTVGLALNGAIIGTVMRDSTSNVATDTLGDIGELWGNPNLTGADVNDPSFGVMLRTNSTGVCTYGQFDLRVRVYFCSENAIHVAEANARPWLQAFPNPAHDRLELRSEVELDVVEMYSMEGRKMRVVSQQEGSIDLSGFSNGVYILRVTNVDGQQVVQRVVVRH